MKKPAPPKQSKSELMEEARRLLFLRFKGNPQGAVDFLLTYFNGWDLEEIIRHLNMPFPKD